VTTPKRKAHEANFSSTDADEKMASSMENSRRKPLKPPKPPKPSKKPKTNDVQILNLVDLDTDDFESMDEDSENITRQKILNIVGVNNGKSAGWKNSGTRPKNIDVKEGVLYEQFSKSDQAPFKVLIEIKEVTEDTPAINTMKIGKILQSLRIQKSAIEEMRKTGKYRIKIVTSNRIVANSILCNCPKTYPSYKWYIHQEDKCSYGIVRNVPLEFEINEIQNEIDPKFNVAEIERLSTQRINKESGTKELLPTTTIKIKFKLNHLPATIELFMVKAKVSPYVWRPRPCSNCLRYGHSFKSCKGTKRCGNCGEIHAEEICKVTAKCLYCGLPHKVGDSQCLEQMKQTELKTIMTVEKKPYREALTALHNKYESLTDINDFPSISDSQGKKPNFPLGKKWRETIFANKSKRENALAAYLKNSKNLVTGEAIHSTPSQPQTINPHKTTDLEKIRTELTKLFTMITQNNKPDNNNDNIMINVASALKEIIDEPATDWNNIVSQRSDCPMDNSAV
jgi:hypothetical protein